MKPFTIKVESMAGSAIRDAIEQAANLAIELDVSLVSFDFNGVKFSISQSPNIDKIIESYHKFPKYVIG